MKRTLVLGVAMATVMVGLTGCQVDRSQMTAYGVAVPGKEMIASEAAEAVAEAAQDGITEEAQEDDTESAGVDGDSKEIVMR